MIRHMLDKEIFLKIGKFIKGSDGFIEESMSFPRKYFGAIIICIQHVCKVKISSIIIQNLLFFLVSIYQMNDRGKEELEMGGEPRKQEPSNYRE